MYAHLYILQMNPQCFGNFRSIYLYNLLDFQVMVAGAQGAHLVPLALFGLLGDLLRVGAHHAAALLDTLQIRRLPVTLLHRPAGAAFEHRVHFPVPEAQRTGAAKTRRNAGRQGIRQRLLPGQYLLGGQARVQSPYAAGDIEADPAARYHTAQFRIEGRDPANGKAITPVGIRHGVGGFDDTGQGGHLGDLLIDFLIHAFDQFFAGINDAGNPHIPVGFDAPFGGRLLLESRDVHGRSPVRAGQ